MQEEGRDLPRVEAPLVPAQMHSNMRRVGWGILLLSLQASSDNGVTEHAGVVQRLLWWGLARQDGDKLAYREHLQEYLARKMSPAADGKLIIA